MVRGLDAVEVAVLESRETAARSRGQFVDGSAAADSGEPRAWTKTDDSPKSSNASARWSVPWINLATPGPNRLPDGRLAGNLVRVLPRAWRAPWTWPSCQGR